MPQSVDLIAAEELVDNFFGIKALSDPQRRACQAVIWALVAAGPFEDQSGKADKTLLMIAGNPDLGLSALKRLGRLKVIGYQLYHKERGFTRIWLKREPNREVVAAFARIIRAQS